MTRSTMQRFTLTALLACAAMALTACSREEAASEADLEAEAPEVSVERGAPADTLGEPEVEIEIDTDPLAAEPGAGLRKPPIEPQEDNLRAPVDTDEPDAPPTVAGSGAAEPVDETPRTPSLFNSLGRALTKGVGDAIGSDEDEQVEP